MHKHKISHYFTVQAHSMLLLYSEVQILVSHIIDLEKISIIGKILVKMMKF